MRIAETQTLLFDKLACRLTCLQAHELGKALAAYLTAAHHAASGDVPPIVALLLPRSLDYVKAVLATLAAGYVAACKCNIIAVLAPMPGLHSQRHNHPTCVYPTQGGIHASP